MCVCVYYSDSTAVKQRLGSTEQFPCGWAEQPGASCYTAAERLRSLPSLENVTLRQTLGWPVKRGRGGDGTQLTLRKQRGFPPPSDPHPSPPHPHEQRPRTWWRLEAQDWASAAWALSVSCLSALFSTVTLPSPICLTNRRNYTTVERTTKKTTKRKKGNDSKDNIDKCESLSIVTETVLLLNETISLENNAANEGKPRRRMCSEEWCLL